MSVNITKYSSRIIGVLLVSALLFSCNPEKKINPEIAEILVEVNLKRFDQEFYSSSPAELNKLKNAFPYMFPEVVNDSVWIQKMKSEEEQFLYQQADSVFNDFKNVKEEFQSLFKYLKYHYPAFNEPTIITHISNLDYEYPVIYADSLLFISLDMFLGNEHEVYSSFPKYISQNYTKENLIVSVSSNIFQSFYSKPNARIFLDKMINEGKLLYALDATLPLVSDHLKIGFTEEKLNWAVDKEVDVWKYFMENELLYQADASLNARFLDLAPFSKFYLATDNDSPGSIGKWIGWQIVRSFMNNNDVTLQQLMELTPEEVFRKSKYKPRK